MKNALFNFEECGLSTLETRKLRLYQIAAFKIFNWYGQVYRTIFYSRNVENTR